MTSLQSLHRDLSVFLFMARFLLDAVGGHLDLGRFMLGNGSLGLGRRESVFPLSGRSVLA